MQRRLRKGSGGFYRTAAAGVRGVLLHNRLISLSYLCHLSCATHERLDAGQQRMQGPLSEGVVPGGRRRRRRVSELVILCVVDGSDEWKGGRK